LTAAAATRHSSTAKATNVTDSFGSTFRVDIQSGSVIFQPFPKFQPSAGTGDWSLVPTYVNATISTTQSTIHSAECHGLVDAKTMQARCKMRGARSSVRTSTYYLTKKKSNLKIKSKKEKEGGRRFLSFSPSFRNERTHTLTITHRIIIHRKTEE